VRHRHLFSHWQKADKGKISANREMPEDADVRAAIPALLSVQQQQRNRLFFTPQCQQRWGWPDGEPAELSPNEVAEFVQTYAWPKETELVCSV
jgi:hypothetical protein